MHTRLELKRIDLGSLFKVAFLLYATVGLVCGLFYALIFAAIGSLGSFFGEDFPVLSRLTGVIGALAIPVLAVGYGVVGSIVIVIGGALYNVAARFMGGVKVVIDLDNAQAAPAPGFVPPAG